MSEIEAKRPFVILGIWPVDTSVDPGEGCDGLHDEGAPVQYLCSRCFPNLRGGDLPDSHDDIVEDEDLETE